jgi:DNA-binding transcriptional MerR regulator
MLYSACRPFHGARLEAMLIPDDTLHDILDGLRRSSEDWRTELSVSIGRARALTGLKETQIRYFEELGALHPAKTGAKTGASRLYTLADLRRLHALAALLQAGHRPAEAAEIVRNHAQRIELDARPSLADTARFELLAEIDGFLLSRLATQLLDAANAALGAPEGHEDGRVVAILLSERPVASDVAVALPTDSGTIDLANIPAHTLIAVDRHALISGQHSHGRLLADDSQEESALVFYSRTSSELPAASTWRVCRYTLAALPQAQLLLVIDTARTQAEQGASRPCTSAQANFERLARLYAGVFAAFRSQRPARDYRATIDGWLTASPGAIQHRLLDYLRLHLFADDETGVAAILVPNSLYQGVSLSTIACSGEESSYALELSVDLRADRQGAIGRAFKQCEPVLTRSVEAEGRAALARETFAGTTLAIPLVGEGHPPFGVLYLASRRPNLHLGSDGVYLSLALATIAGELVGRWWIGRLRRRQETRLHQLVERIIQ